jgi:methionyl-tRNA formyltransferase
VLAPIPMRLFVNRKHLGERLLLVFAHASTLPALRGAVPGYRSSWPG